MDYDSFSHGQIVSKLWLCEKLEPLMLEGTNITILGSWHNVLGFMLNVRKPNYYKNILGVDKNSESIEIANKLNNAWTINGSMRNICENANDLNFHPEEVVINCSVEHFEDNSWYDKIEEGTLVCIQSSDVIDPEYPWLITQPSPTLESFAEKFPVYSTRFLGTLPIQYDNWGYNRFMLIGIK